MNLMMLLEMASGGFGDRRAIGVGDEAITYTELYEMAGRAAREFTAAGVERVSLVDESSPALPIALFGASWAGAAFVPLNYRLDDAGLCGLAERVAPAIAIVDASIPDRLAGVAGLDLRVRPGFLDGLTSGDVPDASWSMDEEEIAVLLYTSGTTGSPKAAVLRHKHLVSYILGSVEFMGAGEEEATLISVPPYHVAGMAAILSAVFAGRRIVQLPAFDAKTWVELARTEAVTHAMVVPTMLARIVEHLDNEAGHPGLPAMRAMSYGGGKMPIPVIERALDLFPNTNFVNAYGLTETSSTIALLGPDEHRAAGTSTDEAVRKRLASVGKPLPTVEVSIRDDEGAQVESGKPGEIWVRGEQVSGEYLEQGSKLNQDGWFPTQDGGWMDDEGYLFVTGRIDDVIIRGGENISPGEIEDVLISHPAVSDACAIGVADKQWGERVVAAVVCTSEVSTAELQAFVRSTLRSSRTPEEIEVLAELPYNETGKLLRRVLRDQLAHLGDGSLAT